MIPWIRDTRLFVNRAHAGKELSKQLMRYEGSNSVVLALPRGGVPIGFEVAKALHTSLNVIIARKIGAPYNKEFGIGALSEKDTLLLDIHAIQSRKIPKEVIDSTVKEERKELQRRIELYRGNKPLPDLEDKRVILVDDGLATGVTAKAVIEAIKKLHPKNIIFASPVCSYESVEQINHMVDTVVCLVTPFDMVSIAEWYRDFTQVSDNEVLSLLREARKKPHEKTGKIYTWAA